LCRAGAAGILVAMVDIHCHLLPGLAQPGGRGAQQLVRVGDPRDPLVVARQHLPLSPMIIV
jgi:hypothetical protein